MCSPTRASFMSGKHPARVRITNWIGGEQAGMLVTGRLRAAAGARRGDARRGVQGSRIRRRPTWANGISAMVDYLPAAQGFDITVGVNGGGQPASYFYPYHRDERVGVGRARISPMTGVEGEYLTDRLTDEAVGFSAGSYADQPFFLVLSHYAVHTPLESKERAHRQVRGQGGETGPRRFTGRSRPTARLLISKQRQDHAGVRGHDREHRRQRRPHSRYPRRARPGRQLQRWCWCRTTVG